LGIKNVYTSSTLEITLPIGDKKLQLKPIFLGQIIAKIQLFTKASYDYKWGKKSSRFFFAKKHKRVITTNQKVATPPP
jgi:hypothetical protein